MRFGEGTAASEEYRQFLAPALAVGVTTPLGVPNDSPRSLVQSFSKIRCRGRTFCTSTPGFHAQEGDISAEDRASQGMCSGLEKVKRAAIECAGLRVYQRVQAIFAPLRMREAGHGSGDFGEQLAITMRQAI
jgi:hypothetical protein